MHCRRLSSCRSREPPPHREASITWAPAHGMSQRAFRKRTGTACSLKWWTQVRPMTALVIAASASMAASGSSRQLPASPGTVLPSTLLRLPAEKRPFTGSDGLCVLSTQSAELAKSHPAARHQTLMLRHESQQNAFATMRVSSGWVRYHRVMFEKLVGVYKPTAVRPGYTQRYTATAVRADRSLWRVSSFPWS